MKQIPEVAKAPAESQFCISRYFCIPEVSISPSTSASFTQEVLGGILIITLSAFTNTTAQNQQ